jgi:hypothetical protein
MPLDMGLVGRPVIGVEKPPGNITELTLRKVEIDGVPERLAMDAVEPKGTKPRPMGVGIKLDVFA